MSLALPSVLLSVSAHDDDSEDNGEDYSKVTYGSAVKLLHKASHFRLHSHQIKWGSGSGQQSVTGFEGPDDPNSLWQIKEGISKGSGAAAPGTVVKCGDVIRLQHASTKRWLHSHLHQSPLTHRQEISGYGEDGGVGSDSGDNWKVECYGSGVTEWARDTPVAFLHVDTGKRLYTRRQDAFDNNNCRGCPIVGQLEISAHNTGAQDANALWVAEGMSTQHRAACSSASPDSALRILTLIALFCCSVFVSDGIYFPVRDAADQQ